MQHKQDLTLHEELTDYDATMIAEGVIEADPETQLRAWQHLEDTGLAYRLQGWFGRRAQDLIAQGLIAPQQARKGD